MVSSIQKPAKADEAVKTVKTVKTVKEPVGKKAKEPVKSMAVEPKSIPIETSTDFPRDGGDELTRLEVREIEDAVLLGKRKSMDKPKKSRIHSLNYQRLVQGMRVLCVVKEILPVELTVSLPNQLTGSVSITQMGSYLKKCVEKIAESEDDQDLPEWEESFQVGMPLLATIVELTETDSKKKIQLSLDPVHVNAQLETSELHPHMLIAGEIESRQDHGFVLSLGFAKGFLPNADVDNVEALKVGQLLVCSVIKVSGTTVLVSCKSKTIIETPLVTNKPILIESLTVGTLVNAKVKEVKENGLIITFASFQGSIDAFHLGIPLNADTDLDTLFKEGSKLKARILHIDPEEKSIALTMRPNLVSWTNTSFDLVIGNTFENVKIKRVDPGVGVLAAIPDCNVPAYIHISRLSDSITKIDKNYRVGSNHTGRIIGLDYCDGLALLSFQPSIIAQPFLRMEDIPVGSDIKGTVLRVEAFGVLITVTNHIRGLCPKIHLSDAKLNHPEKIFKIGSVLKFRVLSVDPAQKRLILTHRKSFMNSNLDRITSYETLPGTTAHGLITAVKPFGCIVTFYNDIRALVPIAELSHDFIQDPTAHFKVGQSVKCKILSADANEDKMKASFKVSSIAGLSVGSLTAGTVLSKDESGLTVKLASGSNGYLPRDQLDNIHTLSETLFAQLKTGDSIDDLVVYEVGSSKTLVSKKSLMQSVFSENPLTWETIQSETVYPGFIRNVTDVRCLVELGNGIIGLVSKHSLSDAFVASVSDHVKVGQVVFALVTQLDVEAKKVHLSLKPSVLESLGSYQDAELKVLSSGFSASIKESAYKIGQTVKGSVDSLMPFGFTLRLKDGTSCLVTRPGTQTPKMGDQVEAVVMDINSDSGILDAAVFTTKSSLADSKMVEKLIGSKVDAVVQMVKPEYAILSIPSSSNLIVFVMSRHLNFGPGRLSRFRVGQSTSVFIKALIQEPLQRVLAFPAGRTERLLDTKRMLVHPIDQQLTCLEDIKLGMMTKGRIQSVKPTQINIHLADNLKGRVHSTLVFDSLNDISNAKSPLEGFETGQIIEAKVVGFHDTKSHNFLPFSHRNPLSKTSVELSIRPSELALEEFVLAEAQPPATIEHAQLETQYLGFVQSVDEAKNVWVQISPSLLGRVDRFLTSTDPKSSEFSAGQAVECSLVRKQDQKMDLSMVPIVATQVGSLLAGRVSRIDTARGLTLSLASGFARAPISELSDEYKNMPTDHFKVNDIVSCVVLEIKEGSQAIVSLKESKRNGSTDEFKEDTVVQGYVKDISSKGCFVELSGTSVARVKVADLSDKFIKDFTALYVPGTLVTGRITSIDSSNRIDMTLKQSLVDPDAVHPTLQGLEKDQIVTGSVKRVEKFGLFIQLDGRPVTGLCHISQIADVKVTKLDELYSVGDAVKARVLKVDQKGGKVSLGLKPSYFTEEDAMEIENDSDDQESDDEAMDIQEDDEESDLEIIQGYDSDMDSDDQEMEQDSENDEDVDEVEEEKDGTIAVKPKAIPTQGLSLSGFSFTEDQPTKKVESEDESSDEEEQSNKLSRRAKKRVKREEEERIDKVEKAMIDGDQAPENASDFEKLLMGSPSNSFLWIKYMAFQLSLAEIEKARGVAEKALSTINYREEQERFNVWVAYLNLENSFGTPESLAQVFERATQMNESKKVHLQLANIYEKSEKAEKAEEVFNQMCKKFKSSCKVWVAYGVYLMKQSKVEPARALLTRALASLDKRKHIKVITKFAQMEFKHGEPERGRTIFEGLLASNPKRVDLWSVYIDLEIKSANVPSTRRLFDRLFGMKWSVKKTKFLFKKQLQFEKDFGSEDSVEAVKQSAMDYVASL